MKRYIIVNATALDASGALGILRQFVANIPDDDLKWLIFISDKISIDCCNSNVILQPIANVKSMPRRFWWDLYGLQKWLKQQNIQPVASISLQNTGFNSGFNVPNFIYYHQSIPLMNFKWNPLKREHRTLWFYKNIYPFFIKLFLRSDTEIFVQLTYIRDLFSQRFETPLDKIHIISPAIFIPDQRTITVKDLPSDKINLFYPATPVFYKNHVVVTNALSEIGNTIRFYTTVVVNDLSLSNSEHVEFLGRIPYEDVLSMYSSCDALIFPSYIETYGLPLIEAASLGVPIIAADLPYAREVLDGYDGVTFVPYNDEEGWKTAILKLKKGQRYQPLHIRNRPSWSDLFTIVKSRINE
ncbi:MAG: glycosyltransferase [Alistipes sp.]|nr:glycosyltransferase [Alistipes sp.]